MYGVIGENDTDVKMIQTLIRRLVYINSIPVLPMGYEGCAEMLRKGAIQLRSFARRGCRRFIVCYDTDRRTPTETYQEALKRIINPAGLPPGSWLIAVPSEEIEAWILADIDRVVPHSFSAWRPLPDPINQPENISSPKEHLERLSRNGLRRERYNHAVHNIRVTPFLDLERVRRKCPSFRPLCQFVQGLRTTLPRRDPRIDANSGRIFGYCGHGQTHELTELCSTRDWGAFLDYSQTLESTSSLTHLAIYGWADVAVLRSEIDPTQDRSGASRIARSALAAIRHAIENCEDGHQFGVTDGAVPFCPACRTSHDIPVT